MDRFSFNLSFKKQKNGFKVNLHWFVIHRAKLNEHLMHFAFVCQHIFRFVCTCSEMT